MFIIVTLKRGGNTNIGIDLERQWMLLMSNILIIWTDTVSYILWGVLGKQGIMGTLFLSFIFILQFRGCIHNQIKQCMWEFTLNFRAPLRYKELLLLFLLLTTEKLFPSSLWGYSASHPFHQYGLVERVWDLQSDMWDQILTAPLTV